VILYFSQTLLKKNLCKKTSNPNSVLFLYEGETEKEFYDKIFALKLPSRKIQINKANLHGIYKINKKVRNKINDYLKLPKFIEYKSISVIVAHDREGTREIESCFNIDLIKKDFAKNKRIKNIIEIIATQDLESWLLHDIEDIFIYLGVPKKERNKEKYKNVEAYDNKHLSTLFHRYGNHYQKGKRVEGFLTKLNLDIIYSKTPELQELIRHILSCC
jgi:hypothetical protein